MVAYVCQTSGTRDSPRPARNESTARQNERSPRALRQAHNPYNPSGMIIRMDGSLTLVASPSSAPAPAIPAIRRRASEITSVPVAASSST